MRRPSDGQPASRPLDFNPRTREGCDQCRIIADTIAFDISIHAPVKGATEQTIGAMPGIIISIHAPVKGATGQDPATAFGGT